MSDDFMKLDKRGCFLGEVDPEEYHKHKSKYTVSKSMLHDFYDSPYSWKWRKDHGVVKSSSGFGFGNLVDCLALTPEKFEGTYMIVEAKARANSKEYKTQLVEMAALGKSVMITQAEYDNALEATENLNEHLSEEWGLVLGKTFRSQMAFAAKLARIEDISLTATGMIDVYPTEGSGLEDTLFDVKTVGQHLDNDYKLAYQFDDFGYHVQAGMYRDGVNLALGMERIKRFVFVCVESVAPYRVRSVIACSVDMAMGSERWMSAAILYAKCLATDTWPGKKLATKHMLLPEHKIKAWEMERGA